MEKSVFFGKIGLLKKNLEKSVILEKSVFFGKIGLFWKNRSFWVFFGKIGLVWKNMSFLENRSFLEKSDFWKNRSLLEKRVFFGKRPVKFFENTSSCINVVIYGGGILKKFFDLDNRELTVVFCVERHSEESLKRQKVKKKRA